MSKTEDDPRPPRKPGSEPAERRAEGSVPRQGPPCEPAIGAGERWLRTRTYRFENVEGALLAVTCVVALAMGTEVWPVVELRRRRLRLRWPSRVELTPRQSGAWADLEGWMRELRGREVTAPEPEGTGSRADFVLRGRG